MVLVWGMCATARQVLLFRGFVFLHDFLEVIGKEALARGSEVDGLCWPECRRGRTRKPVRLGRRKSGKSHLPQEQGKRIRDSI